MTHRLPWLAVAAVVAFGAWLWLRDAQPANKDLKAMATYTENMTTYCVGRFLIDAPKQVASASGTYEFQLASIKAKPAASQAEAELLQKLDAELTQREALLAPQRTYDGKPKFYGRYQPSSSTRSIHFLNEKTSAGFMDGYVVAGHGVFELSASANDQDRVKEFSSFLLEIAPKLSTRRNAEIPTAPGFCVDDGLVSMNPKRGERADWGWTLAGHADVTFGLSTNTNRDRVDPGIVEREGEFIKEMGAMLKSVRMLRKRHLMVSGMKAQEWSMKDADDEPSFDFQIEIPGLANDNAAPKIYLSMKVGGHGKDGYLAPSLSEGEALALWDAVVQSLRLRPGAV